ncbi:MAG: hypothetical protein SVU32_07045 [Candidatus Nanohaloarchaea archaeon]|nr:hypothetical protein [Candidatus Nanohaloarchaea archaeon]
MMYPARHALVSGLVTAAAALLAGVSPPMFGVWIAAGTAAGTLIDVDHVLLAMLVRGRWKAGLSWFQRPFQAMLQPDALLSDVQYPGLARHRMVTHVAVFAVLVAGTRLHALFVPAAVGLGAHVAVDLVLDLRHGNYLTG